MSKNIISSPKHEVFVRDRFLTFIIHAGLRSLVNQNADLKIVQYAYLRKLSVTSELLLELKLGYKPPDLYLNQDRAAYWDGKNDCGECVSSGVYFYRIQVGSYSATRKMVVVH